MEEAVRALTEISEGGGIEKLRKDYTSRIRELEDQLDEARRAAGEAEIAQLSPDKQELGRQLAEQRERADVLAGRMEMLAGELETLREENRELSREAEVCEARGSERDRELTDLRERLGVLQAEKDRFGRDLWEEREQNRELAESVSTLRLQNEEWRRRLEEMERGKR